MFQIDATIQSKFDVHATCRARRARSYSWRQIQNSLSEFWEKLKIKPFTIKKCIGIYEKYMGKIC